MKPIYLFAALVCLNSLDAAAADMIVHDPASGNYHVDYVCAEDDGPVSTTIEPSNKIAPAIESSFSLRSGGISYRYNIELGAASRQSLRMLSMDPIQQVWDIVEPPTQAMLREATADDLRKFAGQAASSAPSGWRAINFTNLDGTARIGWIRPELPESSFVPGSRQEGFHFSSRHLPGVTIARFQGAAPAWVLPCEGPGPGEVQRALDTLMRNDHVPRFAAAPVIKLAHPFNAVDVLTKLHSHVGDLENWQLMDASLANRVRGYLGEAVANLGSGNAPGAASALGKLRVELRRRYPNLDSETVLHAAPPSAIPLAPLDEIRKLVTPYDRTLAARVLDFDAAYVTAQLGPVPLALPASYDCNSPANDQICAPVADADGTFAVHWGTKSCPYDPVRDQSCDIRIVGYRLETSRNPQFIESQQIYQGTNRLFEVSNFPPGSHYFRVTADYRYCVPGRGFGYDDYCDDDTMHWQSASDTYAQGPNKTVVDGP